jgi:hypothetical protein
MVSSFDIIDMRSGLAMSVQSSSRAVSIGSALATAVLVFAAVFGVLVLVSIGVGIARGGDSLLYGRTLSVPLQLSPDDIATLPRDVKPLGWPSVAVEVRDPTTTQMLLRSAMDLGPVVLLVAGLWLLRAFLRSVRDGDPFGAPNVQRLRAIGLILLVGAPLVALLNYSLRRSLYESHLPPHPSLELGVAGFSLPGGALLGGLGALILSEVFAHGLRLREDVAGTV